MGFDMGVEEGNILVLFIYYLQYLVMVQSMVEFGRQEQVGGRDLLLELVCVDEVMVVKVVMVVKFYGVMVDLMVLWRYCDLKVWRVVIGD